MLRVVVRERDVDVGSKAVALFACTLSASTAGALNELSRFLLDVQRGLP